MPSRGAVVVVGSGPGIGRNVAQLFALHDFSRIVLIPRDSSRLSEDADFVRSAANSAHVDTLITHLAGTSNILSILGKVDEKLAGVNVEVVLFNASRIFLSKVLEWKVEELKNGLRIKVLGCYAVAQWALPLLVQSADSGSKPAFLVTSGSIYKDPLPSVFSPSACKPAQHNLVHSLHKEYKNKRVYCGLEVIGGVVADENPRCNAKNIAQETQKLYTQGHNLEVEIIGWEGMRQRDTRK